MQIKYCNWCQNKVLYETEQEAEKGKERVLNRASYSEKKGILMVYKCPYSDGYHLGHKNG